MKTFIKFIVGLVAALLLLVVGGAYLLPAESSFSRSTQIAAPPDKVFEILGNPQRFNEWSPWADLDPKTTYTFSGPPTGVGARFDWASNDPNVGKGSQIVTEYEPNAHLKSDVDFGGMGKSEASWDLKPAEGGTLATWSFHMQADGVMNRWLGLMLERFVSPDYEKGLAKLKALAEKENQGG